MLITGKEAYRIPVRLDQKRDSSQDIIIKTQKSTEKEKKLKAARKKKKKPGNIKW